MKTRTLDLALEWGLDTAEEVTQGMNGYPSGLYRVISGFYTYVDARVVADEVNGEVVLLSKRDGHQLWTNNGRTYEGIEKAKYIDEEEYKVFKKALDFESWAKEDIEEMLRIGEGIFYIQDTLDRMCEVNKAIDDMSEGSIALVGYDYSYYIEDEYVTRLHDDDVTTYMIAVVDRETDEDETNEEE